MVSSYQDSNDPIDDARLIACIQSGADLDAEAAWDVLYLRYGDRLLAYLCKQKGLVYEELEDVAAETWARAVQRIGSYQERGYKFFAWLRGIADRVASEHFRKRYTGVSFEATQEPSAFPSRCLGYELSWKV